MKLSVKRSGRLPLYHQIALSIQQRIASGEWQVGCQIPPEVELAAEYDASRVTVRQALAELEKDHIVVRKRPTGTFVNCLPDKLAPTVSVTVDVLNSLSVLGHPAEITTLSVDKVPAGSADMQRMMGLPPEEEFVEYRRRVDINGAPLAWVRTLLPGSRFPRLETMPIIKNSLQATLETHFGELPARAEHWIEAAMASLEDAEVLSTSIDRQVLRMDTLFFDDADVPMAYMTSVWVADRMRLHLRSSTADPLVV